MNIGFMGLLTIVFITLKLTGYIAWSWWLVLLPMIISISFAVILLVLHVTLNILDPLWKYRK